MIGACSIAYRELKTALLEHHATSGWMVVLDVPNGEWLAMVNLPSSQPLNALSGTGRRQPAQPRLTDVMGRARR